jgi:hypothetical protein
MTTETQATHLHDMQISVNVGDVPEDLLDAYTQSMVSAMQDAIANYIGHNYSRLAPTTRTRLEALVTELTISYDGRSHCALEHTA